MAAEDHFELAAAGGLMAVLIPMALESLPS